MKCWQLIEAVPVRSFNTDHTVADLVRPFLFFT